MAEDHCNDTISKTMNLIVLYGRFLGYLWFKVPLRQDHFSVLTIRVSFLAEFNLLIKFGLTVRA
jgi:hypothetical protein